MPKFRFRLSIAAKKPGQFRFEAPTEDFELAEGLTVTIQARNADSLATATSVHFDAGGFESEEAAREAAEALRVRLRLLNGLLGLGLNVPIGDKQTAVVADSIKQETLTNHGAVIFDSVFGAVVYPDDGRHGEVVFGGNLEVHPSEPSYIFVALRSLWSTEVKLDATSEESLNILSLGSLELSDKSAFLTTYLALEQLITRRRRTDEAIELLERFRVQVLRATKRRRRSVSTTEAEALRGALAALYEESFSSALTRFARSVRTPEMIKGMTVRKFFSACIAARNRIAHNAEPAPAPTLADLTTGLRETVIGLIWHRNGLSSFSFQTPPSAVTFREGAIRVF